MIADVVQLTRTLIACPSITPEDAGCQEHIAKWLQQLGFTVEHLPKGPVANLWATRGDAPGPLFVFAGHTDVVPTGDLKNWQYDPFTPTEVDGYLYGRGAQDMKGSVAAMVSAVAQFLQAKPNYAGKIGFLITSAEEGDEYRDGTPHVMQVLQQRDVKIDYCIVGEPSSTVHTGDVIRTGRRGSLKAYVRVKGIQGHVAHAHLAKNPIHMALPAFSELAATQWDQGTANFLPTAFQISNFNSGTGALNVIPGHADVTFGFRFSPAVTEAHLKQQVEGVLTKHAVDYEINWDLSGNPFFTEPGKLLQVVESAVQNVMQIKAENNTGGGTSDARFIAPTGAQVIEVGPINDRIHKIDERIPVQALHEITAIYLDILTQLFK